MRLLWPRSLDDVDPAEIYGDLPVALGRPGVRLNMVSSLDGATAVDGRAKGLSSQGDRCLFHLMRSFADVILVGADTIRHERYRPSAAPIAVVTRSCSFDWSAPLFEPNAALADLARGAAASRQRPIIFTTADASTHDRRHAEAVADVVLCESSTVDLADVVDELGRRNFARILAEGGPTLNYHLVQAGVLDELCLTVAPILVGGSSRRLTAGPDLDPLRTMELVSLVEEEANLFARYRPAASEV